jgi:hypothetical protein
MGALLNRRSAAKALGLAALTVPVAAGAVPVMSSNAAFVDPIVTLWAKTQAVNAELERADAEHKELRDLISRRRPGQPKGIARME